MSGNNSDAVDQHVAFGDLDALIAALSCAIQEEIDTSKVQNKVGCIGWYRVQRKSFLQLALRASRS